METASIGSYLHKLFSNGILVVISAIGTALYQFFFPNESYLNGSLAVLGIMALDLATKIFALYRQSGSWKAALKTHKINSKSFARGTINKLIVFGVMLIICGCVYRLTIISSLATSFTQLVFTLMFLRDVLSILENLTDAGIDVGPFKRAITKKMNEYIDDPDSASTSTTTSTSANSSSDDTPI